MAELRKLPDPARERVEIARLSDGIEIAYESFGDPSNPTLLLIMGLGMQMLGWDEELCNMLAENGYRVIRFDNRDVGLSTKLRDAGTPNIVAGALGRTGSAPYVLSDMAADAAGLLDHLEVESAHVVGASMGGMIAQTLAARHPERVLSLCSIMSGPGGRRLSAMPRLGVMGTLLSKPPTAREDYAEHIARMFTRIGSPGFEHDPERLRRRALLGYDRCFHPAGSARQLFAILASGDRIAEVRTIRCPTLVIHGRADRLMPCAAGKAVAAAIPGARLELYDGMGHDLPIELWPSFTAAIVSNSERIGAQATAA